MIIKKYFHSCLLVEENGKRLLFDPGYYSFIENKIKPADIGPVDLIIYTHNHQDHIYLNALKELLKLKSAQIITTQEISDLLLKEGIESRTVKAQESFLVEGFNIKTFTAQHGSIPGALPENIGFLVNGKLLHPGDSLEVENISGCEVLALPITAPWLRYVDSIEFAKKFKPKTVIPIHDAIVKDFVLEGAYKTYNTFLEPDNIKFNPLGLDERLEI